MTATPTRRLYLVALTRLAVSCAAIAAAATAPAPSASATPCDEPSCVPNVRSGAINGASCAPRRHFPFGLGRFGEAYLCLASVHDQADGHWRPMPPLIGVRDPGTYCGRSQGIAQSPEGLPLLCDNVWIPYTDHLPV